MQHIFTCCEIPALDLQRAMDFYQKVLGVTFKHDQMDNVEMQIFEAAPDSVSGMLVKGDGYIPSATATVPYLSGGEDLTPALERAKALGAAVVFPKTAIHDGECGYFAQFIDSEGNRIGLYSKS